MFVAVPGWRVAFLGPNFQLLVFVAASNHFAVGAHVVAPGYVSDPVLVSSSVSYAQLSCFKLVVVLAVFPDLDFPVHTSGHKSLVYQAQGFAVLLWVHVIVVLGEEDAGVGGWAPAESVYASIVCLKRGVLPLVTLVPLKYVHSSIS